MNGTHHFFRYLLLFCVPALAGVPVYLHAKKDTPLSFAENKTKTKTAKRFSRKKIDFKYENEDLVDVIHLIAEQKGINVVLPQGDNAIKAKLNFSLEKKIPLDEAWDLLQTMLYLAGFALVPKNDVHVIVKRDQSISKDTLPVYIGTKPEELPDSDQEIKFIHYLANMKASEETENELSAILKELLPPNAAFKMDAGTNALLLSAPSRAIKQLMRIIVELDQVGFQETMSIIYLHNTSSKIVAELLNQEILKTGVQANRYRLDSKKQSDTNFFSKHVRVIAEERTNALIVIGRTQAVERIRDFVNNYIDVEPESGKSVLHVYQLQYLNAEEFAPVLQRVAESSRSGGTGQSTAGKATTGTERFFDEVRVAVDKPSSEAEQGGYGGSNKIIVAARNADWEIIRREIIEPLDIPQKQVLIEVLIADLTLEDTRSLGSQLRQPSKLPFAGDVTFQSSHLTSIITDADDNPQTIGVIENPNKVKADLLRIPGSGTTSAAGAISSAQPGGTLVSINDDSGETWGILQVLKELGHTKILSHPHVVATHNQKSTVESGETRLREGALSTQGGTAVRNFEEISANLKVEITPRISGAETVSLLVNIDINEFLEGSGDARATRAITTNANIGNGDILALGGLIRTRNSYGIRKTPLLADIPLIGWFFKRRNNEMNRTNLTVFISPTIIEPRLRKGTTQMTQDYIGGIQEYAQGDLFESLKQPITRWFFRTGGQSTTKILDTFLDRLEEKEDVVYMAPTLDQRKASLAPVPKQERQQPSIGMPQQSSVDKKQIAQNIKERVGNKNPLKNKVIPTIS